jgi:hypothetical protein
MDLIWVVLRRRRLTQTGRGGRDESDEGEKCELHLD